MSSHFAVLVSLALAIFLSPENLVVGLIVASDKKVPKQAAFAYAAGAIVGIAFATSVGLLVTTLTGADGTPAKHDTWAGFAVRALIATALLTVAVTRAVNAFRKRPIPDPTEPDQKQSKFKAELTKHFPSAMRQFDPTFDHPTSHRITRGALAGFAMCGLHPKVFPIAIAAGHQIVQITRPGERTLGIVLFAVIAVIPALIPAIIETVRPGSASRTKDAYERFMNAHGRWLVPLLLLGAGLFMAHSAWEKFPLRH
ncbi:MAG: GAP family protein [Mycobacterium sp.]|nr:GAP family protein [Mycobacterium sp.]